MDRYIVIGNPVAHSLSPEIHARFAEATGQRLVYERLLVPADAFASHARAFFESGGRGANVTLPFKQDAFAFATGRSARAEVAGAANVLIARGEGRIDADNTDGTGLVEDLLRNHGVDIAGRRVLMLGAGGAARGVLGPLLALEPASITLANRTPARAQELAARFAATGSVVPVALDGLRAERYDVVINATSSSVNAEPLRLPPAIFEGAFAYDMAYGPAARGFLDMARAGGARAADGLGMLVEQAAESFYLWRGVRPATGPVLRELRARSP